MTESPTHYMKQIVGPQGYLESPEDTVPYLRSWRGRTHSNQALVLFPTSPEQVSAIVKHACLHRISLVPQGGNTGLVDGAIPLRKEEVIINLSRMRKIRHFDPLNYTLTAEAGCVLSQIQAHAKEANLLFPLSMASEGSCEVGGFISTNAGGTAVVRYGNTREQVLGLEVVLPNGEIWSGLKRLRKDNTGYDLKHLFIGAEGTLGIITAATFKLYPSQKQTVTAVASLTDIHNATKLLSLFREHSGECVSAFEFFSEKALSLVLKHIPNTRSPFASGYPYYLLIELGSALPGALLRETCETILSKAYEDTLITDAVIAESLEQGRQFWHIREHISEAIKKEGHGIHFDISVPVSEVAAFMRTTDPLLEALSPALQLVPFGHIGDGNIHYNMYLPLTCEAEALAPLKQQAKSIVYASLDRHEGSISAEHGIGFERCQDLIQVKTPTELAIMHSIKNALDPLHLMNPGKLLK